MMRETACSPDEARCRLGSKRVTYSASAGLRCLVLGFVFVGLCSGAVAEPLATAIQDSLPSIESKTRGLERVDGLFAIFWDADKGAVYIEVEQDAEPVLYRPILAGGLGSNDVGLDRGLFEEGKIVRFERIGRKVLLFEDNLEYRASSENPAERKAVEDAFAKSVLFGFELIAGTGNRLLLDATSFVVRDALGIARRLRDTGQGSFSLDRARSAPNPDVLTTFPENVELEAWLTFESDEPGRFVRDVAPQPHAVTLRIRHSFVQLPDEGYEPRRYDPRSGFYGITYVDYATPVSVEKEKRFISRHRLNVDGGRAVEPIIYHLDRGTPEPIRSALLEGARWWTDAFEAAGIEDGFRVEMLPEGADPMDVRYNIIQWVHRSTRGWSWGGSVVDPRTGEILKGHVALGSLRVRQDYLLALGLVGEAAGGREADPMLEMALARLRQLSAHEVGHTLGLRHNFAASVNDRASVMDYPAPLVTLDSDGTVNLEAAYATGIGDWDRSAIRYGYSVFASEEAEAEGLSEILRNRREQGLLFISDEGARPTGGAHPRAHLWDNGMDPIEALETDMDVRRAALDRFSLDVLTQGQPVATLEEVLVPLYLRHRYQLEAVVKLIGGLEYEYAVKGDPFQGPSSVAPEVQRAALRAMLEALEPEALEIPFDIRNAIPPRPPGYGETRELFEGRTSLSFDPFTPAVSLSDFVFGLILDPARAARLHNQHIESPAQPGLAEILDDVSAFVQTRNPTDTPHALELRRRVESSWVRALIRLSSTDDNPPTLAAVRTELASLAESYASSEGSHRRWLESLILRYLERDYQDRETVEPIEMPLGSPIGASK